MEEDEKDYKTKQFLEDREIKKVHNNGESDTVAELRKKSKEMSVLYENLEKVNMQLDFQIRTKNEQTDLEAETKQRLEQLERQAEAKGIDVDNLGMTGDEKVEYSLTEDPQFYQRKENIIKQAVGTDRLMYAKVLEELKKKLTNITEDRNDIVSRLSERQDKTIEIRKEVDELLVKSGMISEKRTTEPITNEIPPEIDIEEDYLINQLNSIIGKSKRKVKGRKVKKHKEDPKKVNCDIFKNFRMKFLQLRMHLI